MRPLAALAAIVALGVPSIPGGPGRTVFGYEGAAARESARVRVGQLSDAPGVRVEIEITYPSGARPQRDTLFLGRDPPTSWSLTTLDGAPLAARLDADRTLVVDLARPGEPAPRGLVLRYEVPELHGLRHGFRHAWGTVSVAHESLHVDGDVVTIVDAPAGVRIPGFTCGPGLYGAECTRTTPRQIQAVPVVLRLRPDALGLALVAITLAGSVVGFLRLARKRAAEIVEAARALSLSPNERPGGAYREPPARAIGAAAPPPPGPAVDHDLGRFGVRAAVVACAAVASTFAVLALAAGRSPWPLPSVAAAWIAIVGLASALIVERA